MITWKAIAIAAIWIGVGIGAIRSDDGAAISFWGMVATLVVVTH